MGGPYRLIESEAAFIEVHTRTDAALQALLHKIISGRLELPPRRGVPMKEEKRSSLANPTLVMFR
jgi:hypothetical protein